jgi:Tfp pilus assembly protein PilE
MLLKNIYRKPNELIKKSSAWSKKPMGFTFVELVISIVVIGILSVMIIESMGSSTIAAQRADDMYYAGEKMADMWRGICASSGVSNALNYQDAGNEFTENANPVLTGGGKTATSHALNLLRYGSAYVDTVYAGNFAQMGITPQPDLVDGGQSWGTQTFMGYPVYLTGGGTGWPTGNMLGPFVLYLQNVPDDIIQMLVKKYGSKAAFLSASGDTTNSVIEYSADTGSGKRNVSIIYFM